VAFGANGKRRITFQHGKSSVPAAPEQIRSAVTCRWLVAKLLHHDLLHVDAVWHRTGHFAIVGESVAPTICELLMTTPLLTRRTERHVVVRFHSPPDGPLSCCPAVGSGCEHEIALASVWGQCTGVCVSEPLPTAMQAPTVSA
jgi:hypothetical protein